ncbi:villin-2-like [Zingiber officinale]|uniref:villin-2-like n=1 Tax=Zingiber officinale TaxID=94328 RepID=UPI001C4BEF5A|nr:villin-2-like [Zingiber officinale]
MHISRERAATIHRTFPSHGCFEGWSRFWVQKLNFRKKNLSDETYAPDGIALIQVSGTSSHNRKAMQVDAVATSLNSYDCFVLQSGNTVFTWNGSSSTHEQQQWVDQTAEFLKPGATLKHCKEGTESSAFWFTLGGMQNFSSKKSTQDVVRDPHLYTFTFKQDISCQLLGSYTNSGSVMVNCLKGV